MSTSEGREIPIRIIEAKPVEGEEEEEVDAGRDEGEIEDGLQYLVEELMQRRGFEELALKNLKLEERDPEKQWVRYSLDVTDELTDPTGALHSGMFGALADLTGSSILRQMVNNSGSVLNMKLAFSSTAMSGSRVVVESRMRKRGDTLAFVQTTFSCTDGRELAHAKTTHYITSRLKRNIAEVTGEARY